jgi:hypothetical protein
MEKAVKAEDLVRGRYCPIVKGKCKMDKCVMWRREFVMSVPDMVERDCALLTGLHSIFFYLINLAPRGERLKGKGVDVDGK